LIISLFRLDVISIEPYIQINQNESSIFLSQYIRAADGSIIGFINSWICTN